MQKENLIIVVIGFADTVVLTLYMSHFLLIAEDLTTSAPHVYEINPACDEKGTDEQANR